MPDVHWCVTVDYEQIVDSNIANQIHGFAIDYGKFILKLNSTRYGVYHLFSLSWVRALVAGDDQDHVHDHKVQNETEAAGDEAQKEIEKRIVIGNKKEEGRGKSLQFWIWDNNSCNTFTSNTFSDWRRACTCMGQESLTHSHMIRSHALKPLQIYCASCR